MMKRMLIDDTQPEETRVVIVDGNKIDGITRYSVEESAEKPVEVSISFSVTDSLEAQL